MANKEAVILPAHYVGIDTDAGNVTYAPDEVAFKRYRLENIGTSSNTATITLTGATDIVLNDGETVELVYNESAWQDVSKLPILMVAGTSTFESGLTSEGLVRIDKDNDALYLIRQTAGQNLRLKYLTEALAQAGTLELSGTNGFRLRSFLSDLRLETAAGVQATFKHGGGVDFSDNVTLLDGATFRIENPSGSDANRLVITVNASNQSVFNSGGGGYRFFSNGLGTEIFKMNEDGSSNALGDLSVGGALSKGSGSFRIDHPLKPETHQLVHSFVEAPQADNIYRGKS